MEDEKKVNDEILEEVKGGYAYLVLNNLEGKNKSTLLDKDSGK